VVNPLSDNLSKSAKCVLTADWRIATQELRHMRAMERIEAKKSEGRWSLRQPKKGRGVPVVKSHWDYMLEEMVSSSACLAGL
jgi:chromatin modification-related protein VID21